jgi:hypothetical protein
MATIEGAGVGGGEFEGVFGGGWVQIRMRSGGVRIMGIWLCWMFVMFVMFDRSE